MNAERLQAAAFMKTTDFRESLAIAQDLNFRIIDIMDDAGARFALPDTSA